MKVLAIRFARFGDIVLLLPALAKLKANLPGSHLTFLTDSRWQSLAEMCPAIDDVIGVDRLGMRDGSRVRALAGMSRLAGRVRRCRFDLVIDFHGFRETNLIAWYSGARQRLGFQRFGEGSLEFCFNLPPVIEDKRLHVGDMFMRVAERFGNARESSDPAIVVPDAASQWARKNMPSPRAVLYLGAPVADRIWPAEGFAKVAGHIVHSMDVSVVALSGPDQSDNARQFLNHVAAPADRIVCRSDLSIPQLAAVIAGSRILVGNDTGPLHLGPALGVPTLGIFSVGFPEHFRPRGRQDRYIRRDPIESIHPDELIALIDEMRANDRSNLQH